ncbi:lantibiotic dehydratase [Spirillospora sp. NPDC052269]
MRDLPASATFDATEAALIRAAAYPVDLCVPPWPDLTRDRPDAWLAWLREAWALPGFADAVTCATPQFAAQITRALAGKALHTRRLRRLIEATVRYVLRWTTRGTPFGQFAGVAPATLGTHAAVHWSERHVDVPLPDERSIAECVTAAEDDLPTLRTARVVTNALGYRCGGAWVLPCARSEDGRRWDTEIGLTEPVRLALETARSPIAFDELASKVAPGLANGKEEAERLCRALVRARALLSEVRPSMTVTAPVPHLARHLAADALPAPGGHVTVDRRVDCSVQLPPVVIDEACRAADTLVAVAPHFSGWAAYQDAFIERWGPGAAVPLREVLNVLGFPAGYRGSPHRERPVFTARDALLADLAQRSALESCAEIVLHDDLIAALRGDDDRPPIPHTELRFALAAPTLRSLDQGSFTLTVLSGSRHAGVAAARFLHLLTPAEQERFRSVYTSLPTALPGADAVQLSAPPLEPRLAAVARAPEMLPVLPAGDFHPVPACTLEDLAVAGDGKRLWLASRTTGRPVEPLLLNSVLLPSLQQPIVRFLTEIWTAWTAPCARFDWGHAQKLAFLPRIRRGRSILHPARWRIQQTDLPDRAAPWQFWHGAWERRREGRRLPRHVLLGDDDVRVRLDLDEPAHLALLRAQLDQHPQVVLTEAPGPAGWIDGRPAELLLTLIARPPRRRSAPRPARPVTTLQHRPGRSRWVDTRLFGRCDDVLRHLPLLVERPEFPTGWWFLRFPTPAPHVRMRIPLATPCQFAAVARELAQWAKRLYEEGLLTDYVLATYRPEARHGQGPTLVAAEAVFAADSCAVLQHLASDRNAATAAGMAALAEGFTGNGTAWLVEHVPHRSGPRLDPTQLSLIRAFGPPPPLTAALKTYRAAIDRDGLDPDQVLADLLHLHHARAIGVDRASELHCLRLARAVAHSALIRRIS